MKHREMSLVILGMYLYYGSSLQIAESDTQIECPSLDAMSRFICILICFRFLCIFALPRTLCLVAVGLTLCITCSVGLMYEFIGALLLAPLPHLVSVWHVLSVLRIIKNTPR